MKKIEFDDISKITFFSNKRILGERERTRQICWMSLPKNPTKSGKIGTLGSPDFLGYAKEFFVLPLFSSSGSTWRHVLHICHQCGPWKWILPKT